MFSFLNEYQFAKFQSQMGLIFIKFNPDSLSFRVAPLAYTYKILPTAVPRDNILCKLDKTFCARGEGHLVFVLFAMIINWQLPSNLYLDFGLN